MERQNLGPWCDLAISNCLLWVCWCIGPFIYDPVFKVCTSEILLIYHFDIFLTITCNKNFRLAVLQDKLKIIVEELLKSQKSFVFREKSSQNTTEYA